MGHSLSCHIIGYSLVLIKQMQYQIKQKVLVHFLQEFLQFAYPIYLYLQTSMDSQFTQNETEWNKYSNQNNEISYVEGNNQHQNLSSTIKGYINSAELQNKIELIKNLQNQLDAKEQQILTLEASNTQLKNRIPRERQEERTKIIQQLQQREKKINQQAQFIKQAEKSRETSFQQIRKLVSQSSGAFLTQHQQIQQKIEICRLNNEISQKTQQINSYQTENIQLKEKLKSAEENINIKDNMLKQLEKQLNNIKANDNQRQVESKNKITKAQELYKILEESLKKENVLLKEEHEKLISELKNQIKNKTDKSQKYKKQLDQTIKSQKNLKDSLQCFKTQKQALQKQYMQSKLKVEQLTKEITQQRKKLQQRSQTQQQISRLSQQLSKINQQLTKTKENYTQKLKDLETSYANFRQQQKDRYQREKRMMQAQHTSKTNELNNSITSLNKQKTDQKQLSEKLNEILKKQTQLLNNKIAAKQQEIKQYQNLMQQWRTIINAETRIANRAEDKQLLQHLKTLIANLKTEVERSTSQEQATRKWGQNYKQLCDINRNILQKLIQNVKSIDIWKKIKEQENNESHLGLLINKLAEQIKTLLMQKQTLLLQKQKEVQTSKKENKDIRNKLQISQINLAQLNKQKISLQIQNRTYKLNAETNNILAEKVKESKQESNLAFERQLTQTKQLLENAKNQFEQQKRINQELNIKLQVLKNQNQSQINRLLQIINELKKTIQSLQKDQKLDKQLNKALTKEREEINEKIKTLQLKINLLQVDKKKMQKEMEERQKILRNQLDENIHEYLQKISKTLEEVLGNQIEDKSLQGIVEFIRKNANSSPSNTSFSVSQILQRLPKQRSFLMQECCKFLGAQYISTKLSFKYDQNFKNFSIFLPTLTNKFLFAVIFKTRKNVVFGVISQFIGRESKAFAFNLNNRKIMNKSQKSRLSSTNYESSMLKFGNEQIIVKNNSSLQIKVNTMIIGQRYFDFIKQDLVGKGEDGDTIQLEAMEIHKIIAK